MTDDWLLAFSSLARAQRSGAPNRARSSDVGKERAGVGAAAGAEIRLMIGCWLFLLLLVLSAAVLLIVLALRMLGRNEQE